ncbi:hypothetical protein [Cupriavidus nantongensis]
MQSVVIVLVSLAAWGFLWRYAARHLRGRGIGSVLSHICGLAIGFLGSTVLLVTLIAVFQPAEIEQTAKHDVKEGEASAQVAASSASVGSPPMGENLAEGAAPAKSSSQFAAKPVDAKTLKKSADELLANLKRLEQSYSPLSDGTPRTNVKLSSLATLELIGDMDDVSSYTVMFGLPSDNKVQVIENSVLAVKVLMNTFPAWKKQGNNPMTWLGDATETLTKNIQRNRDKPEPVVMQRDGLRVRYSAVPALGLFFLTVEPI